MNLIVLLFLVGVIFLGFEVFVPGAVLGIVGALALAGGCVVAFSQFGAEGGGVAVAIALALIGGTLFFEFYVLPRTRLGKKLFLHAAADGRSQALPPEVGAALIGKTAEAATALAPSGYVLIDGRQFPAASQDGFIAKGEKLRVSAADNFTLKVTKLIVSS
jgi:membrane-bound ClpP family serine protease